MNVIVRYENGDSDTISCMRYHPAFTARLQPGIDTKCPAGNWIRLSDLKKKAESKGLTPLQLAGAIECAETQFDILDDESDEPWRNFGNVVKTVPYEKAEWKFA